MDDGEYSRSEGAGRTRPAPLRHSGYLAHLWADRRTQLQNGLFQCVKNAAVPYHRFALGYAALRNLWGSFGRPARSMYVGFGLWRYDAWRLAGQADPQKYNDEVLFPDKVRINIEYLDNWSFWYDIKIIVYTVFGKNL